MKQRDALAAIRAAGLTAVVTDGEYRVVFPLTHYAGRFTGRALQALRQEAESYYTNDADDAVSTAQAMARGKVRDWQAEAMAELH